MLAGQADVIVTATPAGPHIQLLCGEATVTSTVPATVISPNGTRVTAKAGRVVVTEAGKSTTIKKTQGERLRRNDFDRRKRRDSTAVVTSRIKCNCNCR